jgi:hypothetical protein
MKQKSPLAMVTISMIPYLLVAWGYSQMVNGDEKAFWSALYALIAARLFFSILESVGSLLY